MLNNATTIAAPLFVRHAAEACAPRPVHADAAEDHRTSQHIAEMPKLLDTTLAPQRRVVHAGDVIYQAGERRAPSRCPSAVVAGS